METISSRQCIMYQCYHCQVAIDDISVKMQENFQCSERLRLEKYFAKANIRLMIFSRVPWK